MMTLIDVHVIFCTCAFWYISKTFFLHIRICGLDYMDNMMDGENVPM